MSTCLIPTVPGSTTDFTPSAPGGPTDLLPTDPATEPTAIASSPDLVVVPPMEVEMSFSSLSRTATLVGFSEFSGASTPPKKYLNETITGGMVIVQSSQPACAAPACGSSATVEVVGHTHDYAPYLVSGGYTITQTQKADGTIDVTASNVHATRTADGEPLSANLNASGVFGNWGNETRNFTRGQTLNFFLSHHWAYWGSVHNTGSCIYTGLVDRNDTWNLSRSYDPNTGVLGEFTGSAPGTDPEVVYAPFATVILQYEPVYTQTTSTATTKTTAGLGCVDGHQVGGLYFGPRSMSANGSVVRTLTVEDTEANAIARATPTVGASNVARYEQRSGFSFVHVSVVLEFACIGLTQGENYVVTVAIVTEDDGGGNPVAGTRQFPFTASGITHDFSGIITAPVGKQVTVGAASIA